MWLKREVVPFHTDRDPNRICVARIVTALNETGVTIEESQRVFGDSGRPLVEVEF